MTPVSLPFADLSPGEDAADVRRAIDRVLASGWYVLGPELEAFETEFAAACGARYAVGVGNGTDAITLLLRAAGIGPGDEVIVPAMTAAFTGLAVIAAGASPVIVDVDARTLTLDPDRCEAALGDRVRAIVPVHLYGHPANMEALLALAARHQLTVVEDCCQAHLATWTGRPVGTLGIGGAFSFYPTKNLGALGDAGAVVTSDRTIADRVRRLRNGGQTQRYHHDEAGCNSRLDELQAAVLRARLPRLADATRRRRELASIYRARLEKVVQIPAELDAGHVYHLFPIRTPHRDALQAELAAGGIGTLVHYPVSLHEQRAFAAHRRTDCPVASAAASDLLSLPLRPGLKDDDVLAVSRAVAAFLSSSARSSHPGLPRV